MAMRANDLAGNQYGYLSVLYRLPSRVGVTQKKTRWQVECVCGERFACDAADLTRRDGKARVSCGCKSHARGASSRHWLSPNEISSTYWTAVQRSAERRNLAFDLSIESAFEVFVSQMGLCALTGEPIALNDTASLDRIDSDRGYVVGNVQWLHKDVNRLKSDWPQQRFIELCRKVVAHVGP